MTGPQANLSAVVSGILFLFWKPMFRMGIRPETTWTRIERSPFAPQAAAAPVLGKPHAAARQRRVEGAQDVRIARATEDGTEVTLELEHVARVLDTREYEAATPLGRRVIPVLSRPRALASAAAICAPVRCPPCRGTRDDDGCNCRLMHEKVQDALAEALPQRHFRHRHKQHKPPATHVDLERSVHAWYVHVRVEFFDIRMAAPRVNPFCALSW